MKNYELIVILEPKLKKDEKDKILKKLKDLIKENKGEVKKESEWGIRTFAYPINKNKEGFYYFLELKAKGDLSRVLKPQIELEKKILRYLLIRI